MTGLSWTVEQLSGATFYRANVVAESGERIALVVTGEGESWRLVTGPASLPSPRLAEVGAALGEARSSSACRRLAIEGGGAAPRPGLPLDFRRSGSPR